MSATQWIVFAVIAAAVIVIAFVIMGRRRPTGEPGITVDEVIPAVAPLPPVVPLPVEVETPVEHARPASAPVPEAPISPVQALSGIDGIAPEVPPVDVPVPAARAPASVAPEGGDDLRRLKGVGPKIVALLHGEGVTRYAQIAAWTDADMAAFDAKLGSFAGRPKRDNWIDQARFLAAGDVAGYEAKYGKL